MAMKLIAIVLILAICNVVCYQRVSQRTVVNTTDDEEREHVIQVRKKVKRIMNDIEVEKGDGPHTNSFDFDRLPEYIRDLSDIDKNVFFVGQSEHPNSYRVILAGDMYTNCGASKVELAKHGTITYLMVHYTDLTYSEGASRCNLVEEYYEDDGLKYNAIFKYQQESLPSQGCDSSARVKRIFVVSMSPPGEEILLTDVGMYINTSPYLFTPENSTSVYIREDFITCESRIAKTGRKLLTTSCNIDLEEDDIQHTKLIHVTLLGAGDISIVTDKFVKNEYCSHECSYPLGESTYVSVTCPNGYQHRLEVTKTFDESCPGAGVPFVGWFGIFLCRGSDRPTTFLFMIIWIIAGYFIIQLVILLMIWVMNLTNFLIGKTLTIVDEELGVCPTCKTPYLSKDLVKNHLSCTKGICPYCKKPVPITKLPEHCTTCPKYEACKHNCLMKSHNPEGRLKQFSVWFEMLLYYKIFSQSMYMIILVILLVVVISPVNGGITNITEVNEKLREHFGDFEREIYYHDQDILNFDKVFAIESYICGEGCWNGPNECRCPINEYENLTGLYMDEEASMLKAIVVREKNEEGEEHDHVEFVNSADRPHTTMMPGGSQEAMQESGNGDDEEFIISRKKRGIVEGMVTYTPPTGKPPSREPRHAFRLESAPSERTSNVYGSDPYKANPCVTCHISDRAFMNMDTRDVYGKESNSHSSLQALEKIQTEWGNIEINDNIKSTFDDTNLDVEWQTVRLDKDMVKVKGTVIGKLNIGHLSGMSWNIKNKDSDESKTLTLFIYDAVQRYQGLTKVVTGSRYLYTWFRGACTGDCPGSCACDSGTCYHKMFEYDRKWTCNPTWCWTINGGCSCCAVDVKSSIPKWVVVKQAISYLNTNLIFCIKLGTDKLHCDTTLDNKKLTFEGVSITVSKPYGEVKHLPDQISTVFYNPRQETAQMLNPDYIWTIDDVCTSSCNHGVLGDFTANSVADFGNSGTSSKTRRSMSWTGLDIEHTCHTGSWPDCNYYNLVTDIDKVIKNSNDTATHLTSNFNLKYAYVKKDGLVMGVIPKRLTGMIDFTIQMNDVMLRRKENPLKVSRFTISSCKGCYGCTAGFECVGEATLEKFGTYSVHLSSSNKFVNIDQTSRTLNATSKLAVRFPIHAISLLNETEVEFCIVETASCAKTTVILDEPVKKLQRRETIISIQTNDDINQDKCTGSGWFICLAANAKGFFSNIWDWIVYAFKNYTIILSIVIPIIGLLLLSYLIYKLVKKCNNDRKYRGKGRDTHELLERIKEEERKKENEKGKGLSKYIPWKKEA